MNVMNIDTDMGTEARVQVDPSKLPCLSQWKRENTMETILIELRRFVDVHTSLSSAFLMLYTRYMAHPQHKKLAQPAEGSTYV